MFRFFKRLVFGSPIQRTTAELTGLKIGMARSSIEVHVLENGRIGVELVAGTALSYQMLPMALAPESARALAQALESAASEAQAHAA